jgi:hypothetical protein
MQHPFQINNNLHKSIRLLLFWAKRNHAKQKRKFCPSGNFHQNIFTIANNLSEIGLYLSSEKEAQGFTESLVAQTTHLTQRKETKKY